MLSVCMDSIVDENTLSSISNSLMLLAISSDHSIGDVLSFSPSSLSALFTALTDFCRALILSEHSSDGIPPPADMNSIYFE